MPPTVIVTIEGIDGSGKTSLLKALEGSARARAIEALTVSAQDLEPISLLDAHLKVATKGHEYKLDDRAETLVYLARLREKRNRLVAIRSELEPELLLVDRYIDSAYVLATAGRGVDRELMVRLIDWTAEGVMPDLTVICDVDTVERAFQRKRTQGGAQSRKEREGAALYEPLLAGFRDLPEHFPERRFVRLLNTDRSLDDLTVDAWKQIEPLLSHGG
jgi:dTMP kinase